MIVRGGSIVAGIGPSLLNVCVGVLHINGNGLHGAVQEDGGSLGSAGADVAAVQVIAAGRI